MICDKFENINLYCKAGEPLHKARDFDDATSFIADAGLIDKNGNPKPAYNTLLELSEQWKK